MRAIAACAKFRTEHSASADDICAVGQTLAAHELCAGLRPYRKRHHIQSGVGHYGVFSGRAWANQIYLMVKNVILQSD
jgi:poly-beta-hydroxyalkanoate depolymerase